MEEQLVSFETAKLAKEKGFNEQCLECYTDKETVYQNNNENILFTNTQLLTNFYSAPTQSLLQKWLREVHMIRVYPTHSTSGSFNFEIYIWDKPNNTGKWSRIGNISSSKTYEEALEKGLFQALKLI